MTRALGLGAHAIRVASLASIVLALVQGDAIAAAVFALVLLGVLLPRALGLTPALDLAVGVSVLTAAWSSVLRLYERIAWWDVVVHAACTGVIAAMSVAACARLLGLRPEAGAGRWRSAVVVIAVSTGLALAVLWELGEWVGHTYLDPRINVGYADTIGDLAAAGAGAAVAGMCIALRGGLPLRGGAGRKAPSTADRPALR